MFAVRPFTNGGFVVHGITGICKGKVSAWFDPAGKLLDAQHVYKQVLRSVRHGGPTWAELQSRARLYHAMASDLQSNEEG